MPAFRMCDVLVTLGTHREMPRTAHMSYTIGSPRSTRIAVSNLAAEGTENVSGKL